MAGQKGSSLLIKIGDAASPETFTAVTGLRSKSISFNAEQVDISDSDSTNKWRELLAGAGLKSASVSGSGVFKDGATEASVRTEFFAQTIKNYQIVVPDFGTLEGAFQVTSLEYSGEHNGEVTWSMSLESAGEITFTAS